MHGPESKGNTAVEGQEGPLRHDIMLSLKQPCTVCSVLRDVYCCEETP